MPHPIYYLVDTCFALINYGLFAWIIIGFLINFNLLNAYHPVVRKIDLALTRIFEPLLRPIRRYMPDLGGLDLSPIILIVGLNFTHYTIKWLLANMGI